MQSYIECYYVLRYEISKALGQVVYQVYYILSSEINTYLKQIKMVFSQSETI